jgi:hypothetical protein
MDVGSHQRRSLGMKRLGLAAVMIALVAGLVAFGIWRHHVNPPRFEVQVRPRAVMSKSECRGLSIPGFPEPGMCFGAGSGASYVVTVTNTGGRGAGVDSCRIEAIGRSGHVILWSDVPYRIMAYGWPGFPLEPGHHYTFEWFIRVAPERVSRYSGSCSYR